MPPVALINGNTIKPPIAPLGLEYIAEACRREGLDTHVMDLCFAEDPAVVLEDRLSAMDWSLIGISFRNTDSCLMLSGRSFVDSLAELVSRARSVSGASVVIGGAGFSVAPGAIVKRTGADYGIVGDGEVSFVALAKALQTGASPAEIPGLVSRKGQAIERNAPTWPDLWHQPALRRDTVQIPRYFREGGQVGVETSRGCDRTCIYCADRFGKGTVVRRRSAAAVADEIENLLALGVDVYHLCDSEFNLSPRHVEAVCGEIIRRGLGERIRWYAYLTPVPMDPEMAEMMAEAGCAGVNFGADSGDDAMLKRLGRDFRSRDVVTAVQACRDAGMAVMIDLLIGAPGETTESAACSIEMIRKADPHCAGISLGVRLYPQTAITRRLQSQGALDGIEGVSGETGDRSLLSPVYYLSPQLGAREEAVEFLDHCIGGDERFFFGGSGDERDYDYDENAALVESISNGARGAYWDILRCMKSGDISG